MDNTVQWRKDYFIFTPRALTFGPCDAINLTLTLDNYPFRGNEFAPTGSFFTDDICFVCNLFKLQITSDPSELDGMKMSPEGNFRPTIFPFLLPIKIKRTSCPIE